MGVPEDKDDLVIDFYREVTSYNDVNINGAAPIISGHGNNLLNLREWMIFPKWDCPL